MRSCTAECVQALARPDLRLVVMSATLGGGLADRLTALMTCAASGTRGPDVGGEQGIRVLQGSGAGGKDTQGPAAEEPQHLRVPCLTSQGRSFPVKTTYLGEHPHMGEDHLPGEHPHMGEDQLPG